MRFITAVSNSYKFYINQAQHIHKSTQSH